jgi:hypothetical protein
MSVIVLDQPQKILEFIVLQGISKSFNAEIQKFCLPGFKGIIHLIETGGDCRC